MLDGFDPNTWQESEVHEYRIYASNDPDFYVVVDQADYSFLAQNSWSVHSRHDGRNARRQFYLRRSVSDFYDKDGEPYISEFTGRETRNRRRVQRNLFLHFVVMLRKQADAKNNEHSPESKRHHIVDHANRRTRDCTRANLQWVTPNHSNVNQDRHVNKKCKA
jgi:hypothetical protein